MAYQGYTIAQRMEIDLRTLTYSRHLQVGLSFAILSLLSGDHEAYL